MQDIQTPLAIPELDLKPDSIGGLRLTPDMIQSLAQLTVFWQNKRLLAKGSPTGILFTASPQLVDIIHATSSAPSEAYTGTDIKCTEVTVMAHPDNADLIWVRPNTAAAANNSWPLSAGDTLGFTLHNLNQLNALFIGSGDTLIIAYSI